MAEMSLAEARRIVKRSEKEEGAALEKRNREAAERLVGRCFKFWNGGDGRHWWLYVKVLRVTNVWEYTAGVEAEFVQASPTWGVGIEHTHLSLYHGKLGDGYEPISTEEYERETSIIFAMFGLKRA